MKGFVLMVAAGVAAIVAAVVGVMPIQVYDQGEPVSCGPAVLDGGRRFADLACAQVHQPMQTLTVVLAVAAAILIGFGIAALRAPADGGLRSTHGVSGLAAAGRAGLSGR